MKILWSGVERGVMSDFAETPHQLVGRRILTLQLSTRLITTYRGRVQRLKRKMLKGSEECS